MTAAGAPSPRRVRVVGNSGSGKTTLARAVARRTGMAHIELDAVFWAPGWRQRDPQEGQALLRELLAAAPDGWVVCGNWNRRVGDVLDAAEVIVWLDLPRWRIMPRVVRRTVWRGLTRRELWHGNRERLGNLLRRDPEENIVRWAWTQHEAYRRQWTARARAGEPVLRLRTPQEVRAWLRSLPEAAPE